MFCKSSTEQPLSIQNNWWTRLCSVLPPELHFLSLRLSPTLSEPQTSVLTLWGFPSTKALKKLEVLQRTLAHQGHQRHSAYRRDFYLPVFPDHDIVTVSVTNSQYICSYTVASTRQSKFFNGSIQVLSVTTEKNGISAHYWNSCHALASKRIFACLNQKSIKML